MKHKEKIRLAMLHIALICGIVILTAMILDWYNPYMDFSGQIRAFIVIQVCDLAALTLTAESPQVQNTPGKPKPTYHKAVRRHTKSR